MPSSLSTSMHSSLGSWWIRSGFSVKTKNSSYDIIYRYIQMFIYQRHATLGRPGFCLTRTSTLSRELVGWPNLCCVHREAARQGCASCNMRWRRVATDLGLGRTISTSVVKRSFNAFCGRPRIFECVAVVRSIFSDPTSTRKNKNGSLKHRQKKKRSNK